MQKVYPMLKLNDAATKFKAVLLENPIHYCVKRNLIAAQLLLVEGRHIEYLLL